ncbi:HpcH/HpaI aldolase/citrate lyase family protein [Ruminococcaceae bacterium R-25]|nr:HpcH/HpaI aldolase/citrate lyase family protein [Ruminococcaceae bacterium R-25]SUQ11336.1 HpcH/HpaI aldolase/citrate lyase family protein [Oscillospiraceae bacterium]
MTENHLKLFYITNKPEVALIAEKHGVDRIWVDLEVLGKELRQKNLDTVKSKHSISDISKIKPLLTKAEMLVRINSWYEGSIKEIDDVVNAGADIIMLPFWKSPDEVNEFVKAVNGRCRTTLLLETKEAVNCIDLVLDNGGFDEIHIGLNDLHLSYGMTFMFELLANGTVDKLCNKFHAVGIPYGFGGIAKLGEGLLPAEKVIMEHYRIGSTRAILSRSFCDAEKVNALDEIDRIFEVNMKTLRVFESSLSNVSVENFNKNRIEVIKDVETIVERIKNKT